MQKACNFYPSSLYHLPTNHATDYHTINYNTTLYPPGAFYFSVIDARDWTSPQNSDLWGDGIKTLFDPCPPGWRVPRGGTGDSSVWRNFGKLFTDRFGNGAPNATATDYEIIPGSGYHFYRFGISGATAWYPCAGFREPDGIVKYTGASSLIWTTTRMDQTRMHDLYFYRQGIRCWGGDVNTYGNSVRCVRE